MHFARFICARFLHGGFLHAFTCHVPCCSDFYLICSRCALGLILIFFTATSPLCHLRMSGRGAAPPCLSLFDLLPMASNAFHLGLHVFDASAFASLRTSYRLLGWVTFVHHSVKVHVRQLHASGYDSPEYFIFYIPLNIFGFGHIAWPILHLFTFEFNESSRAPAHGPGPNCEKRLR